MASHHHVHDALWAKLHELEVQLAAYKLVRAARGVQARGEEEAGVLGCDAGTAPGGSTRRGRQYDAYMRRRDARRVAAASVEQQQTAKAQHARATRAAGRPMPLSPSALRCAARDAAQEAAGATPRLAVALAKRTPAAAVSIPSTPRRDAAAALPRSRTVSGGGSAAGSPARPSHHQRRSSLGALPELGECATPRPFLKRGTGTGGAGAATPARLRTQRVHDLPAIDVASTPRPLQLPQPQEPAHAQAPSSRHGRSLSELPFEAAPLASPQAQAQARARKRWGSPERPAAMFSAAASAGDSHRDLSMSKGLKKLLSFVRKGGRSGGGDQQPFPAPSPRGGGKPVSKGWSGCSLVDVPFDRASLDAHRFPMTRAVGISG